MYYLYGISEITNNLNVLCNYSSKTADLTSPEFLNVLNEFIRKVSILECNVDWQGTKILNFYQFKEYAPSFYEEKKLLYSINSQEIDNKIKNGYFSSLVEQFKNIDKNIYFLIKAIIKIIIINRLSAYTNGTNEDTLSVSNMDYKNDYDDMDFIELLYHQLVHMLLFLDNRVNGHILDENKTKLINTNIKFVFGGNTFPAYLAFHSYIVGVEVLKLRSIMSNFNLDGKYHGNTDRIVRIIKQFWKALEPNIELFTNRGIEILIKAESLAKKLIKKI